MNGKHWTDDQLLDRLYGIGTGDEQHLDRCPECAARWTRIEQQRVELRRAPQIDADTLARQRRAIYSRLDAPAPALMPRWAMGLAAALLLTAGISFWRPGGIPETPAPLVAQSELSDTQLFAELAALEETAMPRAAAPIRSLFDEGGGQ